jgi:hypothetical protein
LTLVLRIAISQTAFEAIARTLPLGSVSFENATNEKGERLIWLAPNAGDRLRALRGPGGGLIRCHFADCWAGWRPNGLIADLKFSTVLAKQKEASMADELMEMSRLTLGVKRFRVERYLAKAPRPRAPQGEMNDDVSWA